MTPPWALTGLHKTADGGVAMRVMVTGGLGFIGSHLVRWILNHQPDVEVINVDSLTYAGNPENLADVKDNPRYRWRRISVSDSLALNTLLEESPVDAIVNLAAESHVDRSIQSGLPFVETNVLGTQVLLEIARNHEVKRFLQVSTDEVYGSLGPDGLFSETTPLAPNSPYSASKASADLLTLAAFHTYRQDVVVTRCSNNYGPYQFPEKLIPLFVTNGLEQKPWPLYGDGLNVRDWLHVEDHVRALWMVLQAGSPGEVYNIGGNNEHTNREIAQALADLMGVSHSAIVPVPDRLGHDRRYAIDANKIRRELGWEPEVPWSQGLWDTVAWYRDHRGWWERIKSGAYLQYYRNQYGVL